MALIIQDSSNPVSNANSYQSLVDARALAAMYAITLPADDTEAETALINGWAYIDSFEGEMCGERSTDIQNTAYPRSGVYIRCNELPSDEFPSELLYSQLVAAEAFGSGTNLFGGANDGRSIASEKVDVLEVSYFNNGKTGDKVTLPRFDNAIKPLLCTSGNQFNFTVSRA